MTTETSATCVRAVDPLPVQPGSEITGLLPVTPSEVHCTSGGLKSLGQGLTLLDGVVQADDVPTLNVAECLHLTQRHDDRPIRATALAIPASKSTFGRAWN